MNGPYGFSGALVALKQGRKIYREGWNGKGMLIFISQVAPENPEPGVLYREYISMKTAQGDIVPWVASQTDLLANDWFELEE